MEFDDPDGIREENFAKEAKRLAATPGRPLKVVADLCGFGSPGSLRNFFRRETGASLTAWRRADRGRLR